MCIYGEGNGSPLRCSCLENPRDGGAWWAAVYGVAQSDTTEVDLAAAAAAAAKDGEALYSPQKQDQQLTVAQIMNSLLPNSDSN